MTKSKLYIYIIAGGYLAYNGFGLAKSSFLQRPENYLLYLAVGILFMLIGAVFAVRNILKIYRGYYADRTGGFKDEPQKDQEEEPEDN